MIKAVIFDMDGVLIDSEPLYMKWFMDALNYYGIEVSKEELFELAGGSAELEKETLRKWWDNVYHDGKTADEVNNLCEKYWKKIMPGGDLVDYNRIKNENVEEVFRVLQEKGYKTAIASSSSMKNITQVTKRIGVYDFLDEIVSGRDLKESKPNPEIYNVTAKKLKLKNDECIAVEDSTYGIAAAKAAGMFTLAKKDDRFNFDQSPADKIIDDLIEILDLLD